MHLNSFVVSTFTCINFEITAMACLFCQHPEFVTSLYRFFGIYCFIDLRPLNSIIISSAATFVEAVDIFGNYLLRNLKMGVLCIACQICHHHVGTELSVPTKEDQSKSMQRH